MMIPLARRSRHGTRLAYHDRVRVPDGRTGLVIRHRRQEERVLVLLPFGETGEFRSSEVVLLRD